MEAQLLTREEFRSQVLARDKGCCVVCQQAAVAVHHLLERRLFPDGGYYQDNGVSLCEDDHWKAEQTLISPGELRERAGIKQIILPPQLVASATWTKWGDEQLEDGRRAPGELFFEPGVQKILKEAGLLWMYGVHSRFPRTYHLPWSLGQGKDDRVLASDTGFEGEEVVVTEKMDGEATSIYADGFIHARSVDGRSHPSQSRVRALANQVAWQLPTGWRICGENLQALHSVGYEKLPGLFLVYAIVDDLGEVLDWESTKTWCQELEVATVPELYRGVYDRGQIQACWSGKSRAGGEQEGYVVRPARSFPFAKYPERVGKFVRANHIQTGEHHWQRGDFKENRMEGEHERGGI